MTPCVHITPVRLPFAVHSSPHASSHDIRATDRPRAPGLPELNIIKQRAAAERLGFSGRPVELVPLD